MEAQKCNGNDQHVRPKTLVETLEQANPQFYPVVYVVLVTLLTYPVLRTVAPNRKVSFPVCGHVGFVTPT